MFPFATGKKKTRKRPALRVQPTTASDHCKEDQSTSEMPMTEDITSTVQQEGPPSKKQCLSSPEEL